MGRRGPAKEPTAVKLARGETRPSRINRVEPLPREGELRAPADMDDKAKTVWRHMVRYAPPGLLTPYDAFLLRTYCEAVITYRDAQTALAGSSLLVRYRTGLVKNPLHQIVERNREAVRLIGRELGASPAMRAGLSVALGGGIVPDIDDDLGPPRRLRLVAGDE